MGGEKTGDVWCGPTSGAAGWAEKAADLKTEVFATGA